jgi:cell wall assembly regulator SMI1
VSQNDFKKCGATINEADIERLEADLNVSLPESMKALYLKFNGGMPALDWFPMTDDWDPIWIHEFLPIATKNDNGELTIQGVYSQVTNKAGYPPSFIPFAVDPGSNLFCIDLKDGSVHYWLTDTFDAALSDVENRKKADRLLVESFGEFLNSLVPEDEAFG